MPNGGSDCCGTCWFNAKNKGDVGYDHVDDPEDDFCVIRNLAISGDPFYTYCSNHPSHNPTKIDIPIGPVFISGGNYGGVHWRKVWVQSPDTEEVRTTLLSILSEIKEIPDPDYPAGAAFDDMAIWQLGEFREQRAFQQLERVSQFDPSSQSPGKFPRTREKTVELAQWALEQIQQTDGPNSDSPDL
jgi:hypothetical protein